MIIWKDILKPIDVMVDTESTLEAVIQLLTARKADAAFVEREGTIIGYCTVQHIMEQLAQSEGLHEPISYKDDILRVPQLSAVEFSHNISMIIGENLDREVMGYITVKEAKSKINELKLTHLNQLLHGSGVGIVRTNIHYEIEFINETAENILGIPSSFLLFRNYKALLTVDKDLERVMKGETLVSLNSSINFKQMSGNFYPLRINGKITGLVHMFFLREVFEEAVQELDFVRNLYSDLQAVYASSQEQILVIDENGKIIRVAGLFLSNFWKVDKPEKIIGKYISEFTEKNRFQPDVFNLCIQQKKKVTALQEASGGRRVWSVATPVYHEGKLEKVVILSRDISHNREERSSSKSAEAADITDKLASIHIRGKKLVYRSQKIENLRAELQRVAQLNSTVLLEGESGVGKEIFAHKIHSESARKEQAFIRVNCGAIPEQLIESELFGYEKGAFTGADRNGKAGLFEIAHNGTIFLDEIGELPLTMQVKLLRVLQEREITRVGGTRTIAVDVRVITATNKNLQQMVEEGVFREDLYYRLNVIPFEIPPLRERKEDIFPLAIFFLEQFKQMYEIKKSFTPEAIEVLETYDWPGNVRELQNIIERLIVLSKDEWIHRENVITSLYGDRQKREKPPFVFEIMPLKEAVEQLENQLIIRGMQKYGTAAKLSEVLGVSPATISRRMKKLKE
ncbi:sigma 54-interacting transcriptional regulator [Bacillus badius]|uniref:HTH-type transcriptional regulatory protein TyrR n=1 Tax=Bacillus badius TaxID=1455 RepID=A0ABR5AUG7_BACBA|nr:sigma 54-interacting transcriptional regulator [Bacillus badius]KIL78373.1 Response regulator of zinc sigma-54-dependent two-component system [Bacillus badius]MED4715896.1 sigma 54-interacting transcriptional regulator [Bacillus badius]